MSFRDQKVSINYIYFGFLFLCFSLIHTYHVLILENGSIGFKGFFFVYAIAQTFVELAALGLLIAISQRFLPRFFTWSLILFSFILFLADIIDFPLVRIMDMTIWYALGFVTEESWHNIIEMLYASHTSFLSWILGVLLAALVLFLGFLFYRYSDKASQKFARPIPLASYLIALVVVPLLMSAGDFVALSLTPYSTYYDYEKTLPWKTTFLPLPQRILTLPSPLKDIPPENEVLAQIDQKNLSAAKKPNVYLFVIESLRDDYLTAEIAPNLAQFKQSSIQSQNSYANANATQMSWFSIFYSEFPFYWQQFPKKNWQSGSVPLQFFKKLGYEIEVFSSVRLSYYDMDKIIFGENTQLAKQIHLYPHDQNLQAFQSDQRTIGKLCEQIKANEASGRLSIIFLESTHFDYSWPKDLLSPFQPIVDQINYLKLALTKSDVEKIKNRYRNSIHYLDSLFGSFWQTLQEHNEEEAMVVIMGDHGEAFYEHGHIFHASNLCEAQTHIPIYYYFGKNAELPAQTVGALSSHVDIFPTLLHVLTGEENFSDFFVGQSIFSEKRWPFAVAARYNASRSPVEFFIHNGINKLLARFDNEKAIFQSQNLHILSTTDAHDDALNLSMESIKAQFEPALHRIFSP